VTDNAFAGKLEKPSNAELAEQLSAAQTLWDELLAGLRADGRTLTPEWNSYSPKAGWSLRLKHRDRVIVYLSPRRGGFIASFALGDRAVAAARNSGLPPHVIRTINEAKRYAEGTAVRIDVKGPKDVLVVQKLAAVKLQN